MIRGCISVGLDIVEVYRFKKYQKTSKFLTRYFSPEEIKYCFSKNSPDQSLAARFAAKEAFVKAMFGLGKKLTIADSEVIIGKNIVPTIVTKKEMGFKIRTTLSLSHTKEVAAAVVLLERLK